MADTGVVESLLGLVEKADGGVDSLEAAAGLGVDHQLLVGAVKSLQALGDVSFSRLSGSGSPPRQRQRRAFRATDAITSQRREVSLICALYGSEVKQ